MNELLNAERERTEDDDGTEDNGGQDQEPEESLDPEYVEFTEEASDSDIIELTTSHSEPGGGRGNGGNGNGGDDNGGDSSSDSLEPEYVDKGDDSSESTERR